MEMSASGSLRKVPAPSDPPYCTRFPSTKYPRQNLLFAKLLLFCQHSFFTSALQKFILCASFVPTLWFEGVRSYRRFVMLEMSFKFENNV